MRKFLLNVGAEKAGTTWLYEYFKSHPDYHDIGKELNIIQRDDLVPILADVGIYRKNIEAFFSDISSLNKVTGDFTHYEGSSENLFRLLKTGFLRYDIDIVPVYIMRDPIKRAWSSWHMLGGTHENFSMPEPARFLVTNYLDCKYKETVQALDSVFSKPLYFFYETFFTQENINSICKELDISERSINPMAVNTGNYLSGSIPSEFIEKFGNTIKNREAVEFIYSRFQGVPWDKNTYKEP